MSDPMSDGKRDLWGQVIFLILLLVIPSGIFYSLFVLTDVVGQNPDLSITRISVGNASVITTTRQTDEGPITTVTLYATPAVVTETTYMSPTLGLGALDPALGRVRGFFIGPIVFLLGAILETALLILYGAFYVRSSRTPKSPLGLPRGAVRVFILILVVLTILTFAFLPNDWGENKAVVFLFGLLSTVVGFYYGTRSEEEEGSREGGTT